ncbi:hypothetical protein EDB81DRAFT_893595 [Dactylonectria macrodidyma]|uniref:Uncharacterized protein n=1 Tax=Dactylonectria macrodidyma TaxID=307937 RepID=A0A9P9D6G4_9HYPO|nr:hypothetical protein EDB81DRAFT_893595 [Dactylonectria macrodidyma]
MSPIVDTEPVAYGWDREFEHQTNGNADMSSRFGGYELLKTRAIDALGYESASKNRYAVSLGSSAIAEIASGITFCPFEAVRICLVS